MIVFFDSNLLKKCRDDNGLKNRKRQLSVLAHWELPDHSQTVMEFSYGWIQFYW